MVIMLISLFTRSNGENFIDELRNQLWHGATLYELSCREIDPVLLTTGEIGIGGNLHGRHEGAEWGAATRGKEYQVATARGEGSSRYEVVARCREQIQTVVL